MISCRARNTLCAPSYNSATIGNKAAPQVTALGQALTSSDLKGSTFILAGHTDAKGGDTYNQGLSERRADAVKNYLLQKYGIDGSHLVTAGYGKSQLKNTGIPYSAENRRVQIINMADKKEAARRLRSISACKRCFLDPASSAGFCQRQL